MTISGTTSLMRRINSSAVLDVIRQESPIAQSQIARKLNISIPTVMRITESLMADDLVRLTGDTQSSGGRPRTMIEFNKDGYAVIGLDLGGTKLFGTVANLGGEIIYERSVAWEDKNPQSRIDQVYKLIELLLDIPNSTQLKVRGIGVGAPGVTIYPEGIVTWAPSLGWRDLPLRDLLSEQFGLPVIVENDVNLAALGEFWFGGLKNLSSLVCIAVGTGIGAGIVIDRKIFHGHHYSAGEIGYLPPDIHSLGQPYPEFGALESASSGLGLENRAQALINQEGKGSLQIRINAEEIFCAARRGEKWAARLVEETAEYLSLAIASVALLIDPEVIVLGGGMAGSADILLPLIENRLEGVIPITPRIEASKLGSRAAVMGAIILVLDTTTERVEVQVLNNNK